jgi:hypothetical protein
MTYSQTEREYPVDRSSPIWQQAYARLAYDPERARRYADFVYRSTQVTQARTFGRTGVFPDGLGSFVAIRDGEVLDTTDDPNEAQRRIISDEVAPERSRALALADEVARLRQENNALRAALTESQRANNARRRARKEAAK